MPDPVIHVTAFGDPACPWDFSAEGARLRLRWRYGDAIRFEHRMVGLSATPDEYSRRGVTLADLVRGKTTIRDRYGMPIDVSPSPRHLVTTIACRAVVGVRLHAPERVDAFLRRIRVLGLSEGLLIDEEPTLARAAREAGLHALEVAAWADTDAAGDALAEDMTLARDPAPVALAMPERLARTVEGGWRYTCPSYWIESGGRRLDAPGFQPARTYECLVANVAPEVAPRPEPVDVREVLEWAPYPLATAEVAVVMEVPPAVARRRLEEAGAVAHPVAGDAYWTAA